MSAVRPFFAGATAGLSSSPLYAENAFREKICILNSHTTDTEYIILENLYAQEKQNNSLKQRDLAQLTRTSLGMINSILKRMVQKGWITARKINSRNIRYAITLDGINEIFHRSYNFFKRTIKNIAHYRDAIGEIIENASEKKLNAVLLFGTSDLEFIIEHLCGYYGLSFFKSADERLLSGSVDEHTLIFFNEDIPYSRELECTNCVFISQLLLKINKPAGSFVRYLDTERADCPALI